MILRIGMLVALTVYGAGVAMQGDVSLYLERYGFGMLIFLIGWKITEKKR